MNTGARLKKLREAKGLSQEEVAKIIGVGRTTYLKYETGENKPTRKLKELSAFFNVSTDYILGNDTPSTPREKDPADLTKFLNQAEIMFDGDLYKLTESDREKIRAALKLAFWDAKERNKRKKG
jgi:transcriptional regulator with XRE-family HTH domain